MLVKRFGNYRFEPQKTTLQQFRIARKALFNYIPNKSCCRDTIHDNSHGYHRNRPDERRPVDRYPHSRNSGRRRSAQDLSLCQEIQGIPTPSPRQTRVPRQEHRARHRRVGGCARPHGFHELVGVPRLLQDGDRGTQRAAPHVPYRSQSLAVRVT